MHSLLDTAEKLFRHGIMIRYHHVKTFKAFHNTVPSSCTNNNLRMFAMLASLDKTGWALAASISTVYRRTFEQKERFDTDVRKEPAALNYSPGWPGSLDLGQAQRALGRPGW